MGSIIQPTLGQSLQIGGRTLTDIQNLIVLGIFAGSGAYGTLRKMNATAGYQVPAGKTFWIRAFRVNVLTVANGAGYSLGYGDTDSGIGGAAPTNPVFNFGASAGNGPVVSTNVAGANDVALDFSIPQNKYPFAFTFTGGIAGFLVYGYEL